MTANLGQLLVERAADRAELAIGTPDDQMTLRDAVAVAAGGAARLQDAGIDRRHRVALVADNSRDFVLVWMACQLAGVPVALVNPRYPPELLGRMLETLEPVLVFTDLDDAAVAAVAPTTPLSECRGWSAGDPEASPGLRSKRLDLASFMHTSGTTGVPKFCGQTHEYFLRLGALVAGALGLTSADRMLAALPLFHVNPMGYGLVAAVVAGADALALPSFSARRFWPIVREHRITAVTLHAPPVEILKRATTADDAAGHQIRTMFYADGEFMTRFGIPHAVSGYGSTEAGGLSHVRRWARGDAVPSDAGRHGGGCRPDVEDRIDESGEILVRERAEGVLFAGYLDGGRLDRAVDQDGWFATGDLGRRDEAGGLVFLERAAESIRVKGEFVPISYVEQRLAAIAELDDFALWKRMSSLVDDELVLYAVADEIPLEAIRIVADGLPRFMRPVVIAQVGAIPRDSAAGKVQRRLLPEVPVVSWMTLT